MKKPLGTVISEMRKKKLISGLQMANDAKITPNYLSLIENNKKMPSGVVLEKIAAVLGIPVSAMLLEVLEENDYVKPRHRELFKKAKPIIDALIDILLKPIDKSN